MAKRLEAGLADQGVIPPGITLRRTLRCDTEGDTLCCAWSHDGRWLASGGKDGAIRLWDAEVGTEHRALRGHRSWVESVAFSPDGQCLASGSADKTILLWDAQSGKQLQAFRVHQDWVRSVAYSPDGRRLASGSDDGTICLWDAESKNVLRILREPSPAVHSVAFSPDGRRLASGGADATIRLLDVQIGKELGALQGHGDRVFSVAFSPDGRRLASGGGDRTIRLWDAEGENQIRVLEGHREFVNSVVWSLDGLLLASHAEDQTVRLWRSDTWECVAILPAARGGSQTSSLAFHPSLPILATLGATPREINIWDLDRDLLLGTAAVARSVQYANAKVVLLGDTGVGKSGLALALTGRPYAPTDSTHGRHVWSFETREAPTAAGRTETRETLLWDLAGQPGYRLIHQMHLAEVAVALVVFDARSETDPLAGVHHWDRALRQARQRQGEAAPPIRKILVAARTDRGGVSISKPRIEAVVREMGFDGYYETSAKEGQGIPELQAVVRAAVDWDRLPKVTSDESFQTIKQFVLDEQRAGRLLPTADELLAAFLRAHPERNGGDVSGGFETCLGLLQNRDLIRRLSFGDYVLLQPELLDAYASALINAAKEEPEGLGSIAEEDALAGRFRIPEDVRLRDKIQEGRLLTAMVAELIRHDLALREEADDGRYLVFPSQFLRDWPEAPEPAGKAVTFDFDGPVQSAYATLAVRLAHSGSFLTARAEMWRNATLYTAKAGGRCGIYLREFADAKGSLALFFDKDAGAETRHRFEEYVRIHLERRALAGTIRETRSFVCAGCGTTVPDVYAAGLRKRKVNVVACGECGKEVSLTDPAEGPAKALPSGVARMDKAADERRDYGQWLTSAGGEARTDGFVSWAGGGPDATLAIVFTDAVGATALASDLGDERMGEVLAAHFGKVRELLQRHGGREVKTLGDGFLGAFRTAPAALDFAIALHADTGHPEVAIRAALHVGAVQLREEDVFGTTVNCAARILGQAIGAEIWVSERAKQDIDQHRAARHQVFDWTRHEGCELKGFQDAHTLWSVTTPAMKATAGAGKAPPADPAAVLRVKVVEGRFDVFLCHNSDDKAEVKRIAERLKLRGLLPWLDEWEIRPGTLWQEALERQITGIRSVAVFVGHSGIGPWQDLELLAFIREFVKRGCPVIPVLLPGCESPPALPVLLQGFHFVDFRNPEPDPLEQLEWGITGAKP
ncbi:MAG: TIR domain-containing protein [Planctomycetes bacterium]|nr:TIR domain-containing protein [Planctomycetota bacterium]